MKPGALAVAAALLAALALPWILRAAGAGFYLSLARRIPPAVAVASAPTTPRRSSNS